MRQAWASPSGQRRVWAATLAVAVALLGFSAGTAAAVPANFWGVAYQTTPTPEQFQRLKTGGVDSVRVPVSWAEVQPTEKGPLNWSAVDAAVARAVQAKLSLLPFVYDAPSWAVPRAKVPGPTTVRAPKTLPVKTAAERSAWSSFLEQAATRYGPEGTFWSEHPALTGAPLRTWQIWNEPNFKYFVTRPNPGDYGKLVQTSFSALRSVDPGAQIVLAGMFSQPIEATRNYKPPQAYFAADFLEKMYRTTPGIKAKFQGVALHPYTGSFKRLTPEIEEFRRVLARNRDAGKGLWITEIGWSSEPVGQEHDSFAKGPAGQARELKAAFSLFVHKAAKWHLKRVFWFSVDDDPENCNFCGGSGLFGPGFVPKPSWFAYVKFAGGSPG
jgi:hypothetical protein